MSLSKQDKVRSLAAYKAQLTRKSKNPKKYGKISKDLRKQIKDLKASLT